MNYSNDDSKCFSNFFSFFTCGCGKRTSVSPQDFLNKAKDYNYTDVKNSIDFADAAYKIEGDNNLSVLYIKCSNKNTIKRMYYDETNNVTKKAAAELALEDKSKRARTIIEINFFIMEPSFYNNIF